MRRDADGRRLTRRGFLRAGFAAAGVAAAVVVTGCGGGGHTGGGGQPATGPVTIYALSGRGRRVSNAAKSHNANLRFLSPEVALANRAHPGDTSQVVPLQISAAEFQRLFGTFRAKVDLRHV
jgi:hypothetical protein